MCYYKILIERILYISYYYDNNTEHPSSVSVSYKKKVLYYWNHAHLAQALIQLKNILCGSKILLQRLGEIQIKNALSKLKN